MRLIRLNVTTVEHIKIQDMKERESMMLADMYSTCSFAKKLETRDRWDEEWGRPTIEGNIWWLGSKRKNWESVMGQSLWSWFRKFCGSVILLPTDLTLFRTKSRLARQRTMVWITQSTRGSMIRVGGAGERSGHNT